MNKISWIIAVGFVFIGLCFSGCEKALFTDKLPRSPYERYDTLRGRRRQMSEENAYGGTQPALADRLRPLGSP